MALIVEDGSLIVNADTYVSLAVARAYATKRNLTPVAADTVLEGYLIQAMDWIESHRNQFKGSIVDSTQALQFPRKNMLIDGFLFSSTAIPQELLDLQSQLVVEIQSGVDLFVTVIEPFITEETVGPIRTKFSEKSGGVNVNSLPNVDIFLNVLTKSSSPLKVIRF